MPCWRSATPRTTTSAGTGVGWTRVWTSWAPYAWLGLLDLRNLATSLVLLPLAPVGVWMGVRVARRISAVWFYRLLDAGMLLTGCKLTWDGFA